MSKSNKNYPEKHQLTYIRKNYIIGHDDMVYKILKNKTHKLIRAKYLPIGKDGKLLHIDSIKRIIRNQSDVDAIKKYHDKTKTAKLLDDLDYDFDYYINWLGQVWVVTDLGMIRQLDGYWRVREIDDITATSVHRYNLQLTDIAVCRETSTLIGTAFGENARRAYMSTQK